MHRVPLSVTGVAAAAAIALSGLPGPTDEPSTDPDANGVTYTYDRLGRLKTVTDAASATATYFYDSVGNLTKITRASGPGAAPTDIDAQPEAAEPQITTASTDDGVVTVGGTGFSTVLEENVVRIGDLYAVVLSATPTQLTVQVPPKVTSTTLEVSTPGGLATSTAPVTLTPEPVIDTADDDYAPPTAAPGVTAVSGRALSIDREPLAGVTMTIDERSTTTGRDGQFLLTGLEPGHHELLIDASDIPAGDHGTYEQGVDVLRGKTTALPTTTWLPLIDDEHGTTIPTVTEREYLVTSPDVPGLEVHVPKGTSIVDEDGEPVHRLSITSYPRERQPFPPSPGMTLAWTLQPGNATVLGEGLFVVYPNLNEQPPGTPIEYVSHDADRIGSGWAVYGKGKVSADGASVIPDEGTRLHEIYQLSVSWRPRCKALIPLFCPADGDRTEDGDPVDLATGLFEMTKTDLTVPDVVPFSVTRYQRQSDMAMRSFGMGQSSNLDLFVAPDEDANYELGFPDGSSVRFVPGPGSPTVYRATGTSSAFAGSFMEKKTYRDFSVTKRDGSVYTFGSYSASLESITDRYGNKTTFERDTDGRLALATSQNGRWMSFDWDECGLGGGGIHRASCVYAIHDNTGRTVHYHYDKFGRLNWVTDPAGETTNYYWNKCYEILVNRCTQIKEIWDAQGIKYLVNHYDDTGRVDRQTQSDGGTFKFLYTLKEGAVESATVVDPRGVVRVVDFVDRYATKDTFGVGLPDEQVTTYERDGAGRVTKMVDNLGRITTYSYDGAGQVLTTVMNAETDDAATTRFAYDPRYERLASATNPLGNTATFEYDDVANTITLTDPLGNETLTEMVHGQPSKITDALGHTVYFSYLHGDAVAVTDPLGRVTSRFYDSGGRAIRETDASGAYTRFTYDPMNQVVLTIDPLGGKTSMDYDANGNLEKLTDAESHSTTYSYNDMDQLDTTTDALGRSSTYKYDLLGNPLTATDRNRVVTTYGYDDLGRLASIKFGEQKSSDESGAADVAATNKIIYTYDDGNRVTKAADSIGGAITYEYDLFDRVETETSSQGTVKYTYDDAGRRKSMQASGQAKVTYDYDDANQLKEIAQDAIKTTFDYDDVDRRTQVTMPNGVVQKYGYDAAGQLKTLTYVKGDSTVGNLAYSYGKTGLRTKVTGSLAQTQLPAAVSKATYDSANQMTTFNGTILKYDLEGQLLNDGTSTYTWNPRHQLASIDGPTDLTFGYDAVGRRISRTSGATTLSYLYDGANAVQTKSTGGDVTNFLNGASMDEVLQRTDSAGARVPVTDALGSTLALTDPDGAIKTSYSYEPFGATKVTGEKSANATRYTGREQDSEDLYFYRDRYYNPTLQRFVSRDPSGTAGSGTNLYAYVANSPTNYTDPTGNQLLPGCIAGAIGNVAFSTFLNFLTGRKTTIEDVFKDAAAGCVIGATGAWLAELLAALLREAQLANLALRAADNIGDWSVSAKHLPGAGGRWSKWAEGIDINGTVAGALRSEGASFLPNAGGAADRFIVRTNMGTGVGTKGETFVKVVVSKDGRVITGYPVK